MLKAKMGGVAPLSASLRLGSDVQSKWLGEWQVGRSYAPMDKVNRGGSSFVCVRPCTAVDPLVDVGNGVEGQYWILIAAKGKDGSDGEDGVKGDSCNIQASETDEGVELTITNTAHTNSGASNDVQKVLVKNVEGGSAGVFIATYGETPFADIRAAYDAGKMCLCKSANGKSVYTLLTISSSAVNFAGSYTYGARIVAAREVDGKTTWTDTQYKFVREDGGKMTGALTLSGDPTDAMHAATKAYVDAHASGGGEPEVFVATYGVTPYADIRAAHDAGKMCLCVKQQSTAAWFILPLVLINNMNATFCTIRNSIIMAKNVSRNDTWEENQNTVLYSTGDTMTGPLTLPGDPTEDLHAATKKYVDEHAGGGATILTAAIGTSWTDNDDGTKSQTVSMSGVTAGNTAQVDTYYNGGEYADYVEAQNQFLEYITNGFAQTVAGGIKFTIFGEANTVSIPIIVEVV